MRKLATRIAFAGIWICAVGLCLYVYGWIFVNVVKSLIDMAFWL